jgi:hypothetical protein
MDLTESSIENSSNFHMRRYLYLANVPATITYSSASDTATLNPTSNLLPGTKYVVTLTDDIVSKSGLSHLVNAGSWSFTTDTAPEIVSRTPGPGATEVPVDSEIRITFNKKMLAATGLSLRKAGGSAVGVALAMSADKKTLIIHPIVDLEENTTYEVTMTDEVKSETLVPLDPAPVTWQFTTAASTPNLVSTTPAAGATGVAVNQVITATFDKAMDATTLTSATFYLAKSGGSPLPATVTYSAATKTASLDPLADLEEGATYTVTLSNAIKGSGGATLAGAPITWSFMTAATVPVVTSTTPVNGATGVPVNQVISATFDKAMDATTLTSATFYVAKSGGSPLPATVAYSAVTKTASLDPMADLEAGATYNVTLSNAVKGASGQTLSGAPYTWSFTTAASGGGGGGTSSFSDVTPGVTPYATAIIALANDGIITGFTDGTFRPNSLVTRQQFAKMIVLTLGLPVTGAEVCPFVDVAVQMGTDPFYPSKYVAVCALAGITQGKTPTTFGPNENITHQQLISMIARAADLAPPPVAYVPPFTASQFSLDDHYQNARKAAYAGLLNDLMGVGPGYNFLAPSTRGECAQLLYNLQVRVGS